MPPGYAVCQTGQHIGEYCNPPNPGLQVWESWWLQYAEDHQLYTLYTAAQDALAVDHREAVLADTA